jgi:hypothetical protein
MMETADLWKGDYGAFFGGLDRPWHGKVLVQRVLSDKHGLTSEPR